jgi:L-threonylcarbamoyladenylate synthase
MVAARIAVSEESIRLAAQLVREGGLVVFPTDTVYGLGCDPLNASAVRRLSSVKRREAKPIPVLCESLLRAKDLVSLNPRALSLALAYWPGALTIVAPLILNMPLPVHQGSGTLGVRVPGSSECLKLISETGGILTGTSANLSGKPSCRSAVDAESELGQDVDLILDGGVLPGKESTVVRVTDGGLEVLRQGAIKLK